jgi:hypothetical protein
MGKNGDHVCAVGSKISVVASAAPDASSPPATSTSPSLSVTAAAYTRGVLIDAVGVQLFVAGS